MQNSGSDRGDTGGHRETETCIQVEYALIQNNAITTIITFNNIQYAEGSTLRGKFQRSRRERGREQFFHVPPRNYSLKFYCLLSPPKMKWDFRPCTAHQKQSLSTRCCVLNVHSTFRQGVAGSDIIQRCGPHITSTTEITQHQVLPTWENGHLHA